MSEDRKVDICGGVDTHRDVHVAAVVDTAGRVLGSAPFTADTAGYQKLGNWLQSHGSVVPVGVEGTGSYGAGLARRSAIKARTQTINQLHALVVTAPEQVKHQLGELTPKARVKVCAAFRPRPRISFGCAIGAENVIRWDQIVQAEGLGVRVLLRRLLRDDSTVIQA